MHMPRRSLALLGLVLVLQVGCATVHIGRQTVVPRLCADGLPPKLFLHAQCDGGVCGYTCQPDRWPPAPVYIDRP
jgi:hypothetical protein